MTTDDQSIEEQRIAADRRVFVLDEARWAEFVSLLEGPAVEKPRLRKLLQSRNHVD